MKNNTIYVVHILILISFFFSCRTAEFGHRMTDINGMVYDFSNTPVSGYTISLNGKLTSVTDITGRFIFQNVAEGEYSITGEKEGYESFYDTLDISDKNRIVYIRIPTMNQLLTLADTALMKNNIAEAESYIDRAHYTGIVSAELFFYTAVILFRKGEYPDAIHILEYMISMGYGDAYVRQFLTDIKRGMEDAKE